VSLTVVPDETDAEIVCGMLQHSGIECGYRKTNMAGAWTSRGTIGGPAEILVDEKQVDGTRKLLAAPTAG